MRSTSKILPLFLSFFFLSILLFFISQKNIFGGFGILGNALFPLETIFFHTTHLSQNTPQNKKMLQTQDEGLNNAQNMVDYTRLKEDNNALRDQFQTQETAPFSLLPSHIIGAPQFLPGVGSPEDIVLDQGSTSGVKIGQAVVYKTNLIGMVMQVRPTASLVKLVSASGISFPAKTNGTNALGVLKGAGNGTMVLDNVVLADQLQVGDLVVTALGSRLDGVNTAGLIVGKITSIEKNPSSLFQRASVASLLNITKLPLVFVITGTK